MDSFEIFLLLRNWHFALEEAYFEEPVLEQYFIINPTVCQLLVVGSIWLVSSGTNGILMMKVHLSVARRHIVQKHHHHESVFIKEHLPSSERDPLFQIGMFLTHVPCWDESAKIQYHQPGTVCVKTLQTGGNRVKLPPVWNEKTAAAKNCYFLRGAQWSVLWDCMLIFTPIMREKIPLRAAASNHTAVKGDAPSSGDIPSGLHA